MTGFFAFYLIFPFYCVLLKTRRRAWGAFGVSVLMNYAFGFYFDLGRTNIVYSFCHLMAGGLIYLYREELERFSRKYGAIALLMVLGAVVAYFLVGGNTVTMLLVSVLLLVYALGRTRGGLQNPVTKFISSVSMEIYLCHMVIFRVVERMGFNTIIGNGWVQYAVTVVIVLVGAVIFFCNCEENIGLALGKSK